MDNPKSHNFAVLFKKYRLRSEIGTLSQFGNLLAQKGFPYEDSLFTRWQRGERIPKDRKVVLKIIEIFAAYGGLKTVEEANVLLASLELRDLNAQEITELGLYPETAPKRLIRQNAKKVQKVEITLSFFETIWINKSTALLSVFYFVILLWWIILNAVGLKHAPMNIAFGLAFSLIPLYGGITGIRSFRKLYKEQNNIGKALMYLSYGLACWGLGECIWSVYTIFLKIEIPYPSLADLGFVSCAFCWGIGMYYLASATRINRSLKDNEGKLIVLIVPVLATVLSYYLLVVVGRGGKFITSHELQKIFFDLAYPFFDVVLLTEAVLIYGLSFRHIKGRYKWLVLLVMIAIIINYFGDFSFSYTETIGAYYNGSFTDMLFATSLYLLGIGVNSFMTIESYLASGKYLQTGGDAKLSSHRRLQNKINNSIQVFPVINRKLRRLLFS